MPRPCCPHSVPPYPLALLTPALPSEPPALLALHCLGLVYPNRSHLCGAGSSYFGPFLATQVLHELLLLRTFLVLVCGPFHAAQPNYLLDPLAVLLSQQFGSGRHCVFKSSLTSNSENLEGKNSVLILSPIAPSVSWTNNRCPSHCW